MFNKWLNGKNVVLSLIVASYLVRIFITPFNIMVPHIPHDFYAYIGPGKCMVEGKFPLMNCLSWKEGNAQPSVYGPLLSTIFAAVYMAFGQYDFFAYKVIVIAFDAFNAALVYLIAKKLSSPKAALYAALMYSLSFMPLINSAVLGNDEIIVLFFILLSSYFVIEKKMFLSAASYSLLLLLKPFPIVAAPALFFYIYKKYGLKDGLKYIAYGVVCLLALLTIYISMGGFEGTLYYINAGSVGDEIGYTTNLSMFNIFKYITNINLSPIILPIMILSLLATLVLIFKFQIKNPEIELIRNIAALMVVTLLFGNFLSGIYTIYFFPFLLILAVSSIKQVKKFNWKNLLGFLAVFTSLIIYSAIYREGLVNYTSSDRFLLLSALVAAVVGEFYLLSIGKGFRMVWTMIVLATIMYFEVYAAPLVIFPLQGLSGFIDLNHFSVINKLYGDHIMGSRDLFLAYGVFYALPALILYITMSLIFIKLFKRNY